MELRGVDELMDLLSACRGMRAPGDPVDLYEHSLQTAALLRRGRPADKELQVAGLTHDVGRLLRPGDPTGHADRAANAVRPLLGDRVAWLVRLHGATAALPGDPLAEDALALRQAHEAARVPDLDAGVLEDWRTLLELLAARHSRLGAVD
jgi:predicted HD phosphohydrolase